MTQYIFSYLATAIIFAAIDLVWLGFIAKQFYFNRMGDLVSFNMPAAVVFYLVYVAGIVFFAVSPAFQVEENVWKIVLFMGCMFGFFCYATYDLTNLAVIKDWSLSLSIVDIMWGTFLTGSSVTLAYLVTRYFIA